MTNEKNFSEKSHARLRIWLIRLTVLVVLVLVSGGIAVVAYAAMHQATLANPLTIAGSGPILRQAQPTQASNEEGAPLPPPIDVANGSNAVQPSDPELQPWDGAGRVTLLLLGLDYRDWSQNEGTSASRSDTMILLTLDPLSHTAGILSIPRDTWVAIPGFTHAKINVAYYLGDAHKLPGGGPGLAVKTVEQFLGVPINYYAQVDFDTFVRFIDEIGGVKLDIQEPITIDLLGDGPDTIKKLKPGVQTLPGSWALAYARNRHTENGDFDRAARQQQVILAMRDRVLSLNMMPMLIKKAPTLYSELASGIRTNLTMEDAIRLALLAQEVPEENIKRGVIGKGYTIFGRSPDNLSINIPIPDKVYMLRDEIFATSNGALGPLTMGNSRERMRAEGATLAVYNASRVGDLGVRSVAYLQSLGVQATDYGAAEGRYNTEIIDHTGNPYMLQYLIETFGARPDRITVETNPGARVDVEVYLGYDAEGATLQ